MNGDTAYPHAGGFGTNNAGSDPEDRNNGLKDVVSVNLEGAYDALTKPGGRNMWDWLVNAFHWFTAHEAQIDGAVETAGKIAVPVLEMTGQQHAAEVVKPALNIAHYALTNMGDGTADHVPIPMDQVKALLEATNVHGPLVPPVPTP